MATTVSFADSITGDKCSPNVFRVNAKAGQQSTALAAWNREAKPKAKVFFLGRITKWSFDSRHVQEDDRRTRCSRQGSFRSWTVKDYTQYFGQLRQAKPEVLFTSVAGNDTVVCSRRCRILAFWVIFSSLAHPAQ
jgi:branched-chain amino acid transport system substrate-binding protein